MTENVEKIFTFASEEGNKPLGIFMHKDSEFLSFPIMFTCKNEKNFCKEEFNYLQNSFKRNVCTTYSQFPLVINEEMSDGFRVYIARWSVARFFPPGSAGA